MGMHYGFVAIKCPINEFREAFIRSWPDVEIVASKTRLQFDEALDWMLEHENPFPLPKRGESDAAYRKRWRTERRFVFWFFKDRNWTVFWDPCHITTCDEKRLKRLSADFGTVLSFSIETTAGCANFWRFENGKLRRHIGYEDCQVNSKGLPLPEEDGIDTNRQFYMFEFEALWKA